MNVVYHVLSTQRCYKITTMELQEGSMCSKVPKIMYFCLFSIDILALCFPKKPCECTYVLQGATKLFKSDPNCSNVLQGAFLLFELYIFCLFSIECNEVWFFAFFWNAGVSDLQKPCKTWGKMDKLWLACIATQPVFAAWIKHFLFWNEKQFPTRIAVLKPTRVWESKH